MSENLSPQEELSLRRQVMQGKPECPRCGSTLTITPAPPRADVAYVRDRALLFCPECPFKAVVDKK